MLALSDGEQGLAADSVSVAVLIPRVRALDHGEPGLAAVSVSVAVLILSVRFEVAEEAVEKFEVGTFGARPAAAQ